MKVFYKGIASGLIMAILLSLCLTPVVFAMEEPKFPAAVATPSDAEEEEPPEPEEELLIDDITEQPLATPSVATPSVAVSLAAGEAAWPKEDTAATGEELLWWLSDHGDTGGVVRLSDDIYLNDLSFVHGFRQPAVTIDTGGFSIIFDGYTELYAGSPLTIRGLGGDMGVLRVAEGGMLHIMGLTLEAESGYAVFQEEGTGFLMEQTSVSGAVHYAELPFVVEWEDALVVETRGQDFEEGQLPAVLQGRVIRQGQMIDIYEDVPVIWDLAGHEEEQALRRRFTVLGEFEDMASRKAPVCTVVYDDFPLTFLDVKARRITGGRGDVYKFSGSFSMPEDRLPITIAQEYSLDGESWVLYEENTIENPKDIFSMHVRAGEEIPKDIYIRLSWNDGGTMYYSNVLRFAGDSLEQYGEHGGNRGGGTDIVNPPETPEPDQEPPPETPPPQEEPGLETPPPSVGPGSESLPPQKESGSETPPPQEEPGSESLPPSEKPGSESLPPSEEPGSESLPPQEEPGMETPPPSEESGSESPPPQEEPGIETLPPSEELGSETPPPSEGPGVETLPPSEELGSETPPPSKELGLEFPPPSEELGLEFPPPSEEPGVETWPPSGQSGSETMLSPGLPGLDILPPSGRSGSETILSPGLPGSENKPSPRQSGSETLLPPEMSDSKTTSPSEPSGPATTPPQGWLEAGTTPRSGSSGPDTALQPGASPVSRGPDARSAVVGLAAIAASIGGAALYRHPRSRKRLVEMLLNLLKR